MLIRPGDDAPGSAGANRGFVIGVETGGGLLWSDRHVNRSGEGVGGLTPRDTTWGRSGWRWR